MQKGKIIKTNKPGKEFPFPFINHRITDWILKSEMVIGKQVDLKLSDFSFVTVDLL